MKPKEMVELGVPQDCIDTAVNAVKEAIHSAKYGGKAGVRKVLPQVTSAPEMYVDEATWGNLASAIIKSREKTLKEAETHAHNPHGKPTGFPQWGSDFEEQALDQMRVACELPVAVAGAIMPDCLTEDAEVLTEHGFKKIIDTTNEDMVANYMEDGLIFFAPPKAVVVRDQKPNETIFSFSCHRLRDITVSENHRMAFVGEPGINAIDLKDSTVLSAYRWHGNGLFNPKETDLSVDEIRFLAWVVGDGNIKVTHNEKSDNLRIRFGFKKPRKINRVLELLTKLGLGRTVDTSEKQTTIMVDTESSKKYIQLVGQNKHYPSELLLLDREKARALIEELVQVDGDYENYIKSGNVRLNTSRIEDADFFSALCTINAGLTCVRQKEKGGFTKSSEPLYYVTVCPPDKVLYSPNGYHNSEVRKTKIEYQGKLVCLECDTGFFVARQNGQCFITGNCHLGYGLPVGGVLATHNSVIPFGVGVDIACRMKLTVLDLDTKRFDDVFSPKVDTFIRALTGGSVFGVGQGCKIKNEHPVMDMDWSVCPTTKSMKDRAWNQLGTSGSGNHFVEFGILVLAQPDLGLPAGTYVALLSHSGSRGTGATVCKEYSDIAMSKLPKSLEKFKNLAWLSLDSEAGQEYWNAMNLMGEYASANHAIIHRKVAELAGAKILATVENHHNFAWKEVHDGKELVVHRKGATPAGEGVLGVIPGSMATPAYVVRGKGQPESLKSCSHGAGRVMSRTKALKTFNWSDWKSIIKQRGVRLLSAGLDEVPGVYKEIEKVMAAQTDLVSIVARFDPKIVRMSDDGKAED